MNQSAYNTIMSGYYQSNLYHWDTNGQAAYLSISNANPANDMFISYDDQRTCQSKVSYARNHGLGGVMIWELAQDHQNGQPDPLLQAVKQALATPGLNNHSKPWPRNRIKFCRSSPGFLPSGMEQQFDR